MFVKSTPPTTWTRNQHFGWCSLVICSVCTVTRAARRPTRLGQGRTSWSVHVLGNDASSECQIAPGAVRGRRGPGLLPLLPGAPCTTTGDLLCACSGCSSKPATRRQCGRLPRGRRVWYLREPRDLGLAGTPPSKEKELWRSPGGFSWGLVRKGPSEEERAM